MCRIKVESAGIDIDFVELEKIALLAEARGEVMLIPDPWDFCHDGGWADKDGQTTARLILDGSATALNVDGKFAEYVYYFQPAMALKLLEIIRELMDQNHRLCCQLADSERRFYKLERAGKILKFSRD